MNRKWLSLIIGVALILVLMAVLFVESEINTSLQATKPMDLIVSGKNDCLRFLNDSVSLVYVPFTVAANQNWQLTINCTQMRGGANGYTDIYIYNSYWDNGTDHQCQSGDVYSILAQIKSANYEIKGATSFSQTFGGPTEKSYTVFFIFPPGGKATFHITYQQI
jgi:hypothetical protein